MLEPVGRTDYTLRERAPAFEHPADPAQNEESGMRISIHPYVCSLVVLAALVALAPSAVAQQQEQVRVMKARPAPEGPQTELVQGQPADDQGYTYQACQLSRVFMTRSGVGFICDIQNQGASDIIVTSTGGNDGARLAAITDFLLQHHGITLLPVYSRPAVTPVCAEMAREHTDGKTCHELMQVGPVRRSSMRD